MDRLLLGDNQFFGVNHMSEEKARQQQLRFRSDDAIIGVVEDAYAEGIHTLMCTTHDRMAGIAEHFRQRREAFADLSFFPCMPYAHKYANAVTEAGMMGALKRFLPDAGLLDAAMRSSAAVAGDVDGMITLLVDAEMKAFAGLPTPVIWLQNVVTDLLLGMGFDRGFSVFVDHVRARYGVEPGFITMNLPLLAERLGRLGIASPLVCANINKLGFRMSGGLDGYRRALESADIRPVAMSVFASGAIPVDEAIQWVCEQPNIEAIVFGASSRSHLRQTRDLVDAYWRVRT